jgi:hypothetical protein
MKRSGVVALALALGIAAASRAQDKKTIDVFLDDKDVPAAFAEIAAKVHAPILVDPALKGERLTINLQEIPWRDALEVCARMVRADVVWLKGGTPFVGATEGKTVALANVTVREAVAAVTTGTRLQAVVANDVQGNVSVDFKDLAPAAALSAIAHSCSAEAWNVDGVAVVTKRRPVGRSPIAPTLRIVEIQGSDDYPAGKRTLDVDLQNVDVREACEVIGRNVGRNIIVEPDYGDARVTLHAQAIPWWDAIAYVAATTGGEIEWRGSILILSRTPPMSVRTFSASVASVFRILSAYAGKNVAVGPGASVFAAPLRLSSVRWEVALRVAAIANGFDLVEQGRDTVALAPTLYAGIVVDDPTPLSLAEPRPSLAALADVDQDITTALESVEAFPERSDEKIADLLRIARDRPDGFRVARMVLSRWFKRLAQATKMIERELDLAEADSALEGATAAMNDERFEDARALVARARKLVGSGPYHDLEGRKRDIAIRADILLSEVPMMAEAIARGRLVLEAIVIDPRPDSSSRCVLGGRIYQVGDVVLDGSGRPIKDLSVTNIDEAGVKLKYRELVLIRKVPW